MITSSIGWKWVARPWLDVAPVGVAAAVAWRVGLPEGVDPAVLYSTQAAVIGIFAAIITFACTALYGSAAKRVSWLRRVYGRQIATSWIAAIGVTVAGTVASLLAILLAGAGLVGMSGSVACAALTAGILAVARSLAWLWLVVHQEDEESRVVEPRLERSPLGAG